MADVVLVPCRPSILDLEAIANSLDIAKLAHKPATVILNAVSPIGSEANEGSSIRWILGRGALDDVGEPARRLLHRCAHGLAERDTERILIARRGDRVAAQLLRRHVARRADGKSVAG